MHGLVDRGTGEARQGVSSDDVSAVVATETMAAAGAAPIATTGWRDGVADPLSDNAASAAQPRSAAATVAAVGGKAARQPRRRGGSPNAATARTAARRSAGLRPAANATSRTLSATMLMRRGNPRDA